MHTVSRWAPMEEAWPNMDVPKGGNATAIKKKSKRSQKEVISKFYISLYVILGCSNAENFKL